MQSSKWQLSLLFIEPFIQFVYNSVSYGLIYAVVRDVILTLLMLYITIGFG